MAALSSLGAVTVGTLAKSAWPAIAKVGGSALSALGSSGISELFGMSNAKQQQRAAAEMMDYQANINTGMYRNRYQWTVEDMRKAGLNPILAASGGFSVGSSPSVSMPNVASAGMPLAPSISSSAKDWAETSKTEQEEKKAFEETALATKKTITEMTKALKNRAEAGLLSAKERQAAETVLMLQKETNKLASQAKLYEQEAELTEQNIRLARKYLERIKFELKRLKEVSKIYSGPSREVYGWLEAVSRIFGLKTSVPIGSLIGRGRR